MADPEDVDCSELGREETASVKDHDEDDEDNFGDLLVLIDALKLEDKRLDGFLRSKVATLRCGHSVQLQVSAAFGSAHRGDRGDAVSDNILEADYIDANLFRLKGAWNFVLTAVGQMKAFPDVHYNNDDAVLDQLLNHFKMGYFCEPLPLAQNERRAADRRDMDNIVSSDVGSPRDNSGDISSFKPSPLLSLIHI